MCGRLGLRKIPYPLYRLWDLDERSTERNEMRVVLCSSLPTFRPWDLKKCRTLLLYKLGDSEKRRTERSEVSVVLYCYLVKHLVNVNLNIDVGRMIHEKVVGKYFNLTTSLPHDLKKKKYEGIRLPYLGSFPFKTNYVPPRVFHSYHFKKIPYKIER